MFCKVCNGMIKNVWNKETRVLDQDLCIVGHRQSAVKEILDVDGYNNLKRIILAPDPKNHPLSLGENYAIYRCEHDYEIFMYSKKEYPNKMELLRYNTDDCDKCTTKNYIEFGLYQKVEKEISKA